MTPFTGKISKTKVRMRLEPTYDGMILREMRPGELVVVLDETDDFYGVQPPTDFKAYVYRTYVLDHVIEGNHVNVRLKPDLESPVVAQLNSGDRVEGTIDPANNKWLKINMPPSARFYIAKEYVENIGDAGLMARLEKKREEATHLLQTNEAVGRAEMMKPFEQINIDGVKHNYQHLILDFPEFPEIGQKAKEQFLALQEAYADKKLNYAESQHSSLANHPSKKLAEELQAHQSKIAHLEQQIEDHRQQLPIIVSPSHQSTHLPLNMSMWIPTEQNYFEAWFEHTGNHSLKDFYDNQRKEAFVLKGIIEPYNRAVKNKPGDYLLLNPISKLPVAFLYSTLVNLQDYVGHEVSILVSPRPNNHFAFSAYFVLAFE
jgi:hypothetical protein